MGVSLLYVSNGGGEALDAFADVIEGGGAEAEADGVSGGGAGRIGAVAVGSGNVKHAFVNGLFEEGAVAAGVDVWREGEPDVQPAAGMGPVGAIGGEVAKVLLQ